MYVEIPAPPPLGLVKCYLVISTGKNEHASYIVQITYQIIRSHGLSDSTKIRYMPILSQLITNCTAVNRKNSPEHWLGEEGRVAVVQAWHESPIQGDLSTYACQHPTSAKVILNISLSFSTILNCKF